MKKNITAVANQKRLIHVSSLLSVLFILGACFTVLSIPVGFDISVLGFLVNVIGAFLLWVCMHYSSKVKTGCMLISYGQLVTGIKFLEYIPFVFLIGFILSRAGSSSASFVLDFITVIIWCIMLALSIICSRFLSEKHISRLFTVTSDENGKHRKNIFVTILEWIDALFWAVFYVFLFNIFIFQLYEIPSESMVPSFMVQDRVFVFKTSSGPRFPLSKVRLPVFTDYKKGDIVVLRNPRYERTNKTECRSMLSQFIYMITATKVNLMGTDDSGRVIADPLVKRIVGVPGEQLVMVDGVLYSRTSLSQEFLPVNDDSLYANWDLNTLSTKEKTYVKRIPLSSEQVSAMEFSEAERRSFNLDNAIAECNQIAKDFARCLKQAGYTDNNNTFVPHSLSYLYLYQQFDNIAHKLIVSSCGSDWFTSFMTEWESSYNGTFADPYSEMATKLNVLIKLNYGRLLLASVHNIENGFSVAGKAEYEASIRSLFEQAQRYVLSIELMDQRNMPVFPHNAVLDNKHYFMMGDNRFNSLDLRHSYSFVDRSLDSSDEYSIVYTSNMDPVSLPESDILGTTIFRFWPVNRIGLLKRK